MDTYVSQGLRLPWTEPGTAARSAGDVVVLEDMIGIAVADIALSGSGVLEVGRVHELAADSTTAFAIGDQLYWDIYDEKLYKEPAATRVPAGRCWAAKAQSGTTAKLLLNNVGSRELQNPNDVIVFMDDFIGSGYSLSAPPPGWSAIDTSAAGTPTLAQSADQHGGAVEAKFAADNESEAIGIDLGDELLFDIDSLLTFECRFRAPTLNANDALVIGMGSNHNDDPDSITAGAWIHCDGAQDIGCESDDGTTDLDDKDSGVDLGNDVWCSLLIDFSDKSDVKFYLDATGAGAYARVCSDITFDIDQYSAGLQPMAFITKSGGTHQTNLDVDFIRIVSKR